MNSKRKFPGISKRRMQYGSLSVLLVVAFIACVVLFNMGIGFLTDRYSLKADISDTGLYEISAQTTNMLKNLKEPVTAYILMTESEAKNTSGYAQANELLHRYESISNGQFRLEYVDVLKNPAFVQKYDESGNLSSTSFVIESAKRFKIASVTDLYEIKTDSSTGSRYATGFQADQSFASALHYVTTDDLPNVVKVTGHGETYDSEFLALFERSNYAVSEINLLIEDIPADTAMLVIGTPTTDYTADEIKKLDVYLNDNAGNAMVFTDTMSAQLPTLELYFTEWGIEYKNGMVIDLSSSYQDPTWIVPKIQAVDLTADMSYDNNTIVLMPYARQFEKLWDTRGSRTVTEVLQSSSASYAKTYSADKQITSLTKEDGDISGPFPVVLLAQQTKYDNLTPLKSNILFLSSSASVSSTLMSQSAFGNARFAAAALSYMNPTVEALSIEPRDLTSNILTILAEQSQVIMILLVIILPLAVLALGLVVWLKRRNM